MRSDQVRLAVLVVVTSTAAVAFVFVTAVVSISAVFLLRSVFNFIVQTIAFIAELIVAVVAAVTSGATVTLSIIVAAGAAAITFPPSSIEGRISVSVAVSSSSIVASAIAVLSLATLKMDTEIAAAVVSAAAMSVAIAAAWAVGVMSLIEKETHQVGLRMTSILDTVRHNNYRILKLLLKLHIGITQRDLDIALVHSVKAGYPECTRVLLEAGASADARDSYDNTPLILACETGSVETVKMLLDAGASVALQGGGRGTALHKAANWGHDECVKLLLANAADPNAQDGLWRTPLMLAAMHAPKAPVVVRLLVDAGCDVNTPGTESKTAIHYAALRGLDPAQLLAAGADPNALDSGRHTALLLAATAGHSGVVRALLGAGCDPRAVNYQNRTALHLAAVRGNLACLELLLSAGTDSGLADSSGNLPVWYAVNNGHYDATVFFVRNNCRLHGGRRQQQQHHHQQQQPSNQREGGADDDRGGGVVSDPLMLALDKRHMDIARVLLIAGCCGHVVVDWLLTLVHTTWSEENARQLEWMTNFVQNPRELGHLSRLVIRDTLGPNAAEAIDRLPLPKKLREYLFMNDLLAAPV